MAGSVQDGRAGASYRPGLLAAREGPLLEGAVRRLAVAPDVLLVNATGRDHLRRAGLALHLGWVLDLPTVGVTSRPLVAVGDPPPPPSEPGSASPLWIDGEQVGWWVRTLAKTRPLAVSPGWRTELDTVVDLVMSTVVGARTPGPIREARRVARTARVGAGKGKMAPSGR